MVPEAQSFRLQYIVAYLTGTLLILSSLDFLSGMVHCIRYWLCYILTLDFLSVVCASDSPSDVFPTRPAGSRPYSRTE